MQVVLLTCKNKQTNKHAINIFGNLSSVATNDYLKVKFLYVGNDAKTDSPTCF